MYVLKLAAKNISRSKGRSILIGLIIFIIAFMLCIGLCIRQAAADSKEEALADINITAQISPDRGAAMDKIAEGGGSAGGPELSDSVADSLSLEEMKKYAEADSVKSFYYTMSVSMNGSDSLTPYGDSEEDESDENTSSDTHEGMQSRETGDFTLVGYSSDEAMTQFTDGSCTITEGQVFDEGTEEKVCIISDELAQYDSLEVGDIITLASTEDSNETYQLEIVGIYENEQSSADAQMAGMGRGFTDPANYIYTSYEVLESITGSSDTVSGMTNGTYVLGDLEDYEAFVDEVRDMGLSEDYTVSSGDLTSYEQQAEPLDNLARIAGYFLIVILIIGGAILAVLNVFAVRERKYEIGVLTAVGMKKRKVVRLFIAEIMMITVLSVVLGGGIGAAVSAPVTNTLLSSQIESQQESMDNRDKAFGREFGEMSQPDQEVSQDAPVEKPDDMGNGVDGEAAAGPFGSYISEVSSAVNLTVLAELLAACILLAAAAGMVSVISIMRYEPLQILSSRD